MSETAALEARSLGKRYGSNWALHDCDLSIPMGSVTALVGPNGAGKTTLLHLAIGLIEPTSGTITVLGHDPRREPLGVLPHVGFVAQDHPLPKRFTIGETLRVGRELNPSWDDDVAGRRIDELGLSRRQRVGTLSGGQQAQIALTLALAKQPQVLLLDEPVASLDPLARREFLTGVLRAVTETGITVLLSSHIVADLERICDQLIILAAGRTQLVGPIEDILADHRLLTGPRTDSASVARVHDVIRESHTERQTTLLVRANGHVYDARWEMHEVDLEEIVLAYLGQASGGLVPRCRRWWRDDLGRLASAARRDADRRRRCSCCWRPSRSRWACTWRPSTAHEHLGACTANVRPGPCNDSVASFLTRFNAINMLFTWSTLLPALAALLLAAPFVLDLDNGTYRLYWTQSITRRRWIVTKLTLGVVATVVAAGCLAALAMWLRAPLDHLNGRMSANDYDAEGIVPIADALFVLGVAVALGALWRRAVPALLVSFVVYIIGRSFMDSLIRQRLLAPVKTTWLFSREPGAGRT